MSAANGVCATGWRQTNAIQPHSVQQVRHKGREYLQFPIVPLVEMVYEYPEHGTSEYLPTEHIAETVSLWDGVPLTYVHPENRKRSVRDPEEYAENAIGAFHNPEVVNGELCGDGIIDVAKAEELGGHAAALVDDLRAGTEVQVSAGYSTVDDESRSGRFEGDAYDLTQGPPIPDHVAVFPNDSNATARCSPADGCAAPRANANDNTSESDMSESVSEPAMDDERTASETNPVTKEEWEELKAMAATLLDQVESDSCGCSTDESHTNTHRTSPPNMAGVAGRMGRDLDLGRDGHRENVEEYPAGGRRAWERRQVGLPGVPDDDDEYPAGGRSNWEARKAEQRQNAADAAAETPLSAAARRSLMARQNAVEPSEWASAEYPLTARRRSAERAEKRERRKQLREQARRNDPNTVERRHRS